MLTKNLIWLWAKSSAVWEGKGLAAAAQRARFFVKALAVYDSVRPLIEAPCVSPLGRLIERRPETVGAVIWPYQCLGWDAHTRFARIRGHYAAIEKLGGPIDFPVDGRLVLLDLSDVREGLSVIVDQPVWFMREGQLSINLFLGETRLYTLAFSLFPSADGLTAFIGSIQGRDIEDALEEYRKLTKAAHGMRPRDLLIEIFRMFCATLGVTQIFAVSDEHRHHRHRYFGDMAKTKVSANYNEIWEDRGGERVDAMCYRLALQGKQRDLATVPANKRGMYRKRYEILDRLKQQMRNNYGHLSDTQHQVLS